jgi:Rne/Rng family ribonuclease
MKAAFLDLGPARAFLNYDGAPPVEGSGLIVEITADAHDGKDARAVTALRLVGRFAVLEPLGKGHNISQKIGDKDRRARLGQLIPHRHEGRLTLRSRAADAPPALVRAELARLLALWDGIAAKAAGTEAPALLLPAPSPLEEIATDWLTRETRIVTATSDILPELVETLDRYGLAMKERPHFDPEPGLFARAGAEEAFAEALSPVLPLSGGGLLHFSETPALVAVDVDGGNAQSWAPGATADAVNAEAALRLPHALRLRHLGGTIVVDFIGFEGTALEALRRALLFDPLASRPVGVAGLGLAVFTRKRLGPSLAETMTALEHIKGDRS